MVYDLPGVQVAVSGELESFQNFSSRRQSDRPVLGLRRVAALPFGNTPLFTAHHKEINVAVLEEGWQFSLPNAPTFRVFLSQNRKEILAASTEEPWQQGAMLPLVRTAIEFASALEGVISLHSACVEIDGQAICFTALSGTGKSTRALQWVDSLGATWISGDRPSLKLEEEGGTAWGVPWGGKEQIYRNVHYPLKMICLITRGQTLRARKLPPKQARQILMQQVFLPMWATEAAAACMATIRRLQDRILVVQLQCGPDAEAARQAYDLIYCHPEKIEEE